MLRVVAVLAALAVGATAVLAQNAAGIAARKEAMKGFGGAFKEPNAMAKGDAWTTGVFGAITLVTSLNSIPGFALGAALLTLCYVAHTAGKLSTEAD